MASERLQKVLAAAGIASRRKAEELITGGHVSINGKVVTELGTKADPRMDEIHVDGKPVGRPERHVYYMLYKPKGVMTTVSDPEGRPTVLEQMRGVKERLFPVGRLDYMSEGLLLMTNDGDLMAKLTAAGSHVAKTYQVKVSGRPTEEDIDKLRGGIMLPPEPGLTGARGKKQPGTERRSFAVRTQPAEIELVKDQDNPWYEVTLIEGRNRQIRRMFEQIGYHVEKIKRVRYGSLELNVEPGEFRPLSYGEIQELRKSLDRPYKIKPPRRREEETEQEGGERRGARGPRREGGKPPARVAKGRGERGERPAFGGRDREERRPRTSGFAERGFGARAGRDTREDRGTEDRARRGEGRTGGFGAQREDRGGDFRPKRSFGAREDRGGSEFRPKRSFGGERAGRSEGRPEREQGFRLKQRFGGDRERGAGREDSGNRDFRPKRSFGEGRVGEGRGRGEGREERSEFRASEFRPKKSFGAREDRGASEFRPKRSFGEGQRGSRGKGREPRGGFERGAGERGSRGGRGFGGGFADRGGPREGGERPAGDRPFRKSAPRRDDEGTRESRPRGGAGSRGTGPRGGSSRSGDRGPQGFGGGRSGRGPGDNKRGGGRGRS